VLRKRQSPPMPSLGTYQRAYSLVKMRWFAHVLARLAIAASCTSTAAALDAQADRSKSLSSADSSWERMMPNSSQSANSVTRRYSVPGRALYIRSRDGRDIVHDGLTRAPRLDEADVRSRQSVMLPMTQPDRQHTPLWWSPILASFMQGFALYGASYCGSPHAIAALSVDTSAAEASAPELEENSWRARRRTLAIVSSAMSSGVTEVTDDANRAGAGSDRAFGNSLLETDESNPRHRLTMPWRAIARRWAQWRREREIKKAIAPLVEPDGRASRNFGIPNRSRDEQVARYRCDC
jgi:hypothetical protein